MTTYDWTDIYPTLNLSLIFVNFSLHHLQVFIKRIIIKLTNQKETELIMINIPEILVANGTGAFLVLFLLLYRIRIAQTNQFDEKIYNFMLIVTFIGTVNETLSFIIDAHPGFIFHILQYILLFYYSIWPVVINFFKWWIYHFQNVVV